MSEHIKDELRMMNQMLLAIFVAANYAYFLSLEFTPFPWFSFIGVSIGLAIILFCWIGRKYTLFTVALLAGTAVFSILYNWSVLFSVH
jgi:hypothetical protein